MSPFTKNFRKYLIRDKGPFPSKPIDFFQFDISPGSGENLANHFVNSMKKALNIDLDYSPESIIIVDNILHTIRDEGNTVDKFAKAIFLAGCYVGEALVKNNGYEWIWANELNHTQGMIPFEIAVKFGENSVCYPITKAFKRFYYGSQDSLMSFYKWTIKLEDENRKNSKG